MSGNNADLSKITEKLGEHEFRITKLEYGLEILTNNVKELSKAVKTNHEEIKLLRDDIKDLKEAYKEYAENLNKQFSKLLNGLLNREKKQQNIIERYGEWTWKIILTLIIALSGLKLSGII